MERTRILTQRELSELTYALALATHKNNRHAIECSLGELEASDSDALEDYKAERERFADVDNAVGIDDLKAGDVGGVNGDHHVLGEEYSAVVAIYGNAHDHFAGYARADDRAVDCAACFGCAADDLKAHGGVVCAGGIENGHKLHLSDLEVECKIALKGDVGYGDLNPFCHKGDVVDGNGPELALNLSIFIIPAGEIVQISGGVRKTVGAVKGEFLSRVG